MMSSGQMLQAHLSGIQTLATAVAKDTVVFENLTVRSLVQSLALVVAALGNSFPFAHLYACRSFHLSTRELMSSDATFHVSKVSTL